MDCDRLLHFQSIVICAKAVNSSHHKYSLPKAPLSVTSSHPFRSSSNALNGLLFILHLCKSFVHIAAVPVPHTRCRRLRMGITRLPASHPAVRCTVSPRPRLGSVTRTRDHRDPPATILFSPLLKLLREWRACSQGGTVPVDSVDSKDEHEGDGEEDCRGDL